MTLRDPRDLLLKLRGDYERMRSNSVDPWAAFDFFVTATAMRDWCRPPEWTRPTWADRSGGSREGTLYQLCRDVGNGSKHFRPKASIEGVTKRKGAFQPEAFNSGAFDTGDLLIHLASDEANVLGKREISATELAREILEMWRAHIETQ